MRAFRAFSSRAKPSKSSAAPTTAISLDNINSHVKNASYAVRGPIVSRAQELAKTRQSFFLLTHLLTCLLAISLLRPIISCNIGNPHALQQPALSYIRDVLSLVINPSLAEKSKRAFKPDVIERAQKYLNALPDVGAYTESQGIGAVREEICEFLLERDGFEADPNNIFLTNGASEGVRLCMQTIMR